MDRAELERLDRESLVQRAQAAGIRRARVLTRPELVDELLRLDPRIDATQLKKSRGFFGRARDLLTRVVERGLHLPDAADRLRAMALGDDEPATREVPRPEPQAVPTVTLAEIYAAQGHKARAIETLRRVLDAEPEHAAARQLLEKLEAIDYVEPPPPLPPEPETQPDEDEEQEDEEQEDEEQEDEEELPVTNAEAAQVEANEARDAALKAFLEAAEADEAREAKAKQDAKDARDAAKLRARQARAIRQGAITEAARASEPKERQEPLAPQEPAPFTPRVEEPITIPRESKRLVDECVAIPVDRDASYVWWRLSGQTRRELEERRFVVRALVVAPSWDGPKQVTRDIACEPEEGEVLLRGFPEHAIVRIAVGWLDGAHANVFIPLAHSPALETTAENPGELVQWTLNGVLPVALSSETNNSIAQAARQAASSASRIGT